MENRLFNSGPWRQKDIERSRCCLADQGFCRIPQNVLLGRLPGRFAPDLKQDGHRQGRDPVERTMHDAPVNAFEEIPEAADVQKP